MSHIGSDFAQWNPIKDMAKAKAAGLEFAILKVINKSNNPEKAYKEHLAKCQAAGVPVIAGYTYSYASTAEKAKVAADAFIRTAANDIDTMVLDLEDVTMTGLGHRIVDIIMTYKDLAEQAGLKFVIYTGASYYNPCLRPFANEIAAIPIWWARYPSTASKTLNSKLPDMKYLPVIPNQLLGWQYSSRGQVPGIDGCVDLNAWFTDIKDTAGAADKEITVDFNKYMEPTTSVKLGSIGEGAKWVQWYLWRFGLLTNANGAPDESRINGNIDSDCVLAIKESQKRLGVPTDGIVGPVTRAVYKKTL
ncbi:MAG: GH25 family lysozyme [Lachnospiraceae bacterium]